VSELSTLQELKNGKENTFYYSGVGAQTVDSNTTLENGNPEPNELGPVCPCMAALTFPPQSAGSQPLRVFVGFDLDNDQ